MTDRRVTFAIVELPLRFSVPGADALAATATEVTYVAADGAVGEVQLACELTLDAYRRVDRERLFHLEPSVRGPGADRFAPSGAVSLTLRLAAAELAGLLAEASDPAAAGALLGELSRAATDAPLLSTDAWFALSVTSRVAPPDGGGALARGYATTRPARPRPLALPMLEVAAAVLEQRGWEYEQLDDDTVLGWPMSGPDGEWSSFAVAREAERRFAVYSMLGERIPAPLRADAAQLVARINWGLPVGNWELDMDDGSVRCKTSVDVAGDRLSTALAARVVERNLAVVDAYLAAFAAFAAGRATVGEALALAEGPDPE